MSSAESRALSDVVGRHLLRGDLPSARGAAERSPALIADLYRVAFERLERTRAVTPALEAAVERERAQLGLRLKKNLWILGTIGATTPFVGLFGTVAGIMRSFRDLGLDVAAGGSGGIARGDDRHLRGAGGHRGRHPGRGARRWCSTTTSSRASAGSAWRSGCWRRSSWSCCASARARLTSVGPAARRPPSRPAVAAGRGELSRMAIGKVPGTDEDEAGRRLRGDQHHPADRHLPGAADHLHGDQLGHRQPGRGRRPRPASRSTCPRAARRTSRRRTTDLSVAVLAGRPGGAGGGRGDRRRAEEGAGRAPRRRTPTPW